MSAEILITLGVLLLFAKALGSITEKLGLASLVGEIIAGIILGSVFGMSLGEAMPIFLTVGVIFLLFVAGLGVKYDDIKGNAYQAGMSALFCSIVPFVLGLALGIVLFGSFIIGVALGAILASTNDGVVFSLLMKMNAFQSRLGRAMIATDIADDIIGVLLLSFFVFYATSSSVVIWDLWSIGFAAIGFYFVFLTAGPRIMHGVLELVSRIRSEHITFVVVIAFAFLLSAVAENIAMGVPTGAFLAGISVATSKHIESDIKPKIKAISDGFFIPIFFGAIGMMMVLKDIDITLMLIILIIAIFGKLIPGILSGGMMKLGRDSLLFGMLMIPRGETNIVVAQVALVLGVISTQLFTATTAAMIITIIITPIIVKTMSRRR